MIVVCRLYGNSVVLNCLQWLCEVYEWTYLRNEQDICLISRVRFGCDEFVQSTTVNSSFSKFKENFESTLRVHFNIGNLWSVSREIVELSGWRINRSKLYMTLSFAVSFSTHFQGVNLLYLIFCPAIISGYGNNI